MIHIFLDTETTGLGHLPLSGLIISAAKSIGVSPHLYSKFQGWKMLCISLISKGKGMPIVP